MKTSTVKSLSPKGRGVYLQILAHGKLAHCLARIAVQGTMPHPLLLSGRPLSVASPLKRIFFWKGFLSMRLSLQGYFDLGASFGLAGTEQIANMGIVNPCSGAEVHTLSGSGIEDEWKRRAVKKANDPELHLDHVVGSSTNHSEADDIRFRKRLADCIEGSASSSLSYTSIPLVPCSSEWIWSTGVGIHRAVREAGWSWERFVKQQIEWARA